VLADRNFKSVYFAANAVQDPLAEPNNGLMIRSNLPEEAVKSGRNIQNKTRMSENASSFSLHQIILGLREV